MPRFFWQNICRGSFASMRPWARSRWDYFKFVCCKLTGTAAWQFHWFGTLSEADSIAEAGLSNGMHDALAEVGSILAEQGCRLVYCVNYPTVHPDCIGQAANFISADGVLGLSVCTHEWLGTRTTFYSCSSQTTDGAIFSTLSGSAEDRGCWSWPPELDVAYANTPSLAPVLALHRERCQKRSVMPWSDGEVKRVVIDLWNELFEYNEQLGVLREMTALDQVHVESTLDKWVDEAAIRDSIARRGTSDAIPESGAIRRKR